MPEWLILLRDAGEYGEKAKAKITCRAVTWNVCSGLSKQYRLWTRTSGSM